MNGPTRTSLRRSFSLLSVLCVLSSAAYAQSENSASKSPAPASEDSAGNASDNNGGQNAGRMRRGQNGGRGNFDPAQMQERMLNALREQFGVTDDAEWKAISERISAVTELRRSAGGFGGMGALRGGGRRGGAANPEQDALRQAIADKLPDAEIKARLERFRETRKANEEKLAKAQEDLRSILSVRQEAVAVMFGLIP